MKTLFSEQKIVIENPKYTISLNAEGLSYNTADGKKSLEIKFSEVGAILPMRYCNSNQSYNLIFRDNQGKNICDIDTDTKANNGHNILETKLILVAFAAYKLTQAFPDNLFTLDLTLGFNLKEKEIRIANGVISGAKHKVDINRICRAKCVTNGTISNLAIYTKEKGGFFDTPDMTLPVNEITLPLIEAIMMRNTGKGIDFSRGDGFGQRTSEFVIIRYMEPSFFIGEDGTIKEEWQEKAYERVKAYGYSVAELIGSQL